jgi:hypothetical protein
MDIGWGCTILGDTIVVGYKGDGSVGQAISAVIPLRNIAASHCLDRCGRCGNISPATPRMIELKYPNLATRFIVVVV